MSRETHKILCGSCRVQIVMEHGTGDLDPVTCPRCGRTDSKRKALEEVSAYLVEQAGKMLETSFQRGNRPGSGITFSVKRGPRRTFRYITD